MSSKLYWLPKLFPSKGKIRQFLQTVWKFWENLRDKMYILENLLLCLMLYIKWVWLMHGGMVGQQTYTVQGCTGH